MEKDIVCKIMTKIIIVIVKIIIKEFIVNIQIMKLKK